MDNPDATVRQAVLVLDACTFNPFKNFKTTKIRLKQKIQRQLLDQPRIARLLIDLEQDQNFTITRFMPIAVESWGRANDEQVLQELEKIAWKNPNQMVIFITRDLSFCQEAGWRPEMSRVYICILPRNFFSKSIDQYSRLDMMYIITIDITHFFTQGKVTYSRLYIPH